MRADVLYKGCCKVLGMLYDMRFSMVCGMLYGRWDVVCNVGCCMICGSLYGIRTVAFYVVGCIMYGLL